MKYLPYLVFTLTRREFTFNEAVITGPARTFKHHNQINRNDTKAMFSMEKKLLITTFILQTVTSVQLIKLVPVFPNGPAPSETVVSFFAVQPDS